MTATTTNVPASSTPATRSLWQWLGYLAIVALAYEAVHFYLRDPLHYLLDHSEAGFRKYWPERWWLLAHIAGGTLALFCGPFQLWSGLKRRSLRVHRLIGYAYITGIAVGGGAAFYMATQTPLHDFGLSLIGLAFAWWTTVGMAFLAIRRRQIDVHKEWMIRGYVVTFAFVIFRWLVELPVWGPLGNTKYAAVGWLCWSVPLLLTEVVLQFRRTPRRARSVRQLA